MRSEVSGKFVGTHGLSRTPEYRVWIAMKARCSDPNVRCYPDYGGRGIKVCKRWMKFENFYADMGPRPSSHHSIDRYPNKNGNYEPKNCRWATRKEQQRNIRSNKIVNGKCLVEVAEGTSKPAPTVAARLKRGWTTEATLNTPVRLWTRMTRRERSLARQMARLNLGPRDIARALEIPHWRVAYFLKKEKTKCKIH